MKIIFGEIFIKNSKTFRSNSATLINSEYVPNVNVVQYAAKKAIKNWRKGKRISKSISMEILLYYSATRQIKDALKLGIKDGLNRVVAVVLDTETFSKEIKFRELEFKPKFNLNKILAHYNISQQELEIAGIEKVPLLIRERIALFSIYGE